MSDTPLYDAMLGDLVARARAGDAAGRALAAAADLHAEGPGGRCAGCGLDAPCPSARLLSGDLDLTGARSEARRVLVARAVEEATVGAAAQAVVPAPDTEPDSLPDADADRPTPPVMPSVAELFARNPGTSRALDALLGAPSRV